MGIAERWWSFRRPSPPYLLWGRRRAEMGSGSDSSFYETGWRRSVWVWQRSTTRPMTELSLDLAPISSFVSRERMQHLGPGFLYTRILFPRGRERYGILTPIAWWRGKIGLWGGGLSCLLYTSPSPRDGLLS